RGTRPAAACLRGNTRTGRQLDDEGAATAGRALYCQRTVQSLDSLVHFDEPEASMLARLCWQRRWIEPRPGVADCENDDVLHVGQRHRGLSRPGVATYVGERFP